MPSEDAAASAYDDGVARVICGDAREVLRTLPSECVQCCVTSPPYWGLRDYGLGERGIGLEGTPEMWVDRLVGVFGEVGRVLRQDGTLWLNVGDTYSSVPSWGRGGGSSLEGRRQGALGGPARPLAPAARPKDLLMLPARLALALRACGWYLRSDVIWSKPNPMPESVSDRPTSSYEHIFLFARSERYFYDADAIREPSADPRVQSPRSQGFARDGAVSEHVLPGQSAAQHRSDHKPPSGWDFEAHGRNGPGRFKQDGHGRRHEGFNDRYFDDNWHPREDRRTRNSRNVWTIPTQPYPEAHFATFPEELARRCIAAGTRERDTVLDPFAGSGTTLAVAKRLNRDSIGIELQADYLPLIVRRLQSEAAQPSLPVGEDATWE